MTITQNDIYLAMTFTVVLSLITFFIGWTTGVQYGRFKEKHKLK